MFTGDVTDTPEVVEIPGELAAVAADARDGMIQSLADLDDAIAVKYLDGHDLEAAELDAAIRKATIAVKMVPVLGGTALRNKGIHPLLDAVIAYLPSPADVPPVTGVDQNTTEKRRAPKNSEPFARWRSRSRWTRAARSSSGIFRHLEPARAAQRAPRRRGRGCSIHQQARAPRQASPARRRRRT